MTLNMLIEIITGFISVAIWFTFPGKMLTFKNNRKLFTVILLILNLVEPTLAAYITPFSNIPLKSLLYFAQYAVFIIVAFEEPLRQKLMSYMLSITSIILAEFTAMLISSAFEVDISQKINGIYIRNITIIFCAVLSYFFNIFACNIYNKIKYKKLSNNLWQFHIIVFSQFILIVALSSSLFSSNALISSVFKSPLFTVLLLTAVTLTIIGDICLYRILITNSENYELKNELEVMQMKNELELKYYEKMRKSIAETRKINHDFNNILTVVQNTIKTSAAGKNRELALKTVEELKDTLKKNKVKSYCENELVNLIIITKSEEIIDEGIDFSVNISIPQNINIKNSDLCRIFTNLLDNAKEACITANNKEKAFIILSSTIKDDYLYITTENYYDRPITKNNNTFVSSKQNHKGLGIEILKEIAERYSGTFVSSYTDNFFTATVSLGI